MAARFLRVNSSNSRRYDAEGGSDILRSNSEQEIIRKFRMSKSDIGQICDMVQEKLTPLGYRNVDLSLPEKVILCLKTLGTESFQTCSNDFIKVS